MNALQRDLDGRVAVVTGATSGIGAATSVVLARAGAAVMLSGRDADAAANTSAAVGAAGGVTHTLLGDVADPGFADELIAKTRERLGRVDIVVNGAGIIVRADATETSDEDWRRQMAVNVDATFFVSRAAVGAMRERGSGVIVNIASNVGLVGAPGLAGYCASKGAVVMLTKAMALDHAAEGIRINCVCPGSVDTPMLRSGRDRAPMDEADILAMNVADIPQGRIPDAEEVGQLIAFLASDRAGHLVGTAIPIDGGYVAR